MKRKFSILTVGLVIAGLTLSLVGTALVSQAASPDKSQSSYRQVLKPVPATNVKIAKKVPLPPAFRETKDRPDVPPGQEKKKDSGGEGGAAATGVLGEQLSPEATKYAVVIGICDYPGTENDICVSDGDARNMYNALINLFGYDPSNIYLLRDMDATYEAILAALDDIRNRELAGDEVVFFFSGHGAYGTAKDGDEEEIDEAIVTHDGSDVVFIWDGVLKELFSTFDTSRIAFVFDSCLAGGMNDVAAEGRIVVMGTEENQLGYVYSQGEYGEGFFSHYFVNEGMLLGLADKYDHDNDGVVAKGRIPGEGDDVVVEEGFDYAKKKCRRLQTPTISDYFANDLLL